MDDTLFPTDPFEPLTRLEDQLRHSRERLMEGAEVAAAPADSIPAHLAPRTDGPPEVHEVTTPALADFSFAFADMTLAEEDTAAAEVVHAAADDDDDVWEPFPAIRATVEADMLWPEPAAEKQPASVPEQDPLVIDPRILAARSASPVVAGDADRAVAEAAREVSWLARRVADGLDSVTGRLDAFERQVAELAARPTQVAAAAGPSVPQASAADPTALEEWSMALARLVRADSNALRDEVHRIAAEQGTAMAEVHRLTEENGTRISEAVEDTIARIDTAVLRLADSIEKRLGSAIASLESAADAMRSEDQEALVQMIDDRMEALARLMRSDNERISARLEAEIGIGREVLRAAKELQASLANDVATALDQRDRMFRTSSQAAR